MRTFVDESLMSGPEHELRSCGLVTFLCCCSLISRVNSALLCLPLVGQVRLITFFSVLALLNASRVALSASPQSSRCSPIPVTARTPHASWRVAAAPAAATSSSSSSSMYRDYTVLLKSHGARDAHDDGARKSFSQRTTDNRGSTKTATSTSRTVSDREQTLASTLWMRYICPRRSTGGSVSSLRINGCREHSSAQRRDTCQNEIRCIIRNDEKRSGRRAKVRPSSSTSRSSAAACRSGNHYSRARCVHGVSSGRSNSGHYSTSNIYSRSRNGAMHARDRAAPIRSGTSCGDRHARHSNTNDTSWYSRCSGAKRSVTDSSTRKKSNASFCRRSALRDYERSSALEPRCGFCSRHLKPVAATQILLGVKSKFPATLTLDAQQQLSQPTERLWLLRAAMSWWYCDAAEGVFLRSLSSFSSNSRLLLSAPSSSCLVPLSLAAAPPHVQISAAFCAACLLQSWPLNNNFRSSFGHLVSVRRIQQLQRMQRQMEQRLSVAKERTLFLASALASRRRWCTPPSDLGTRCKYTQRPLNVAIVSRFRKTQSQRSSCGAEWNSYTFPVNKSADAASAGAWGSASAVRDTCTVGVAAAAATFAAGAHSTATAAAATGTRTDVPGPPAAPWAVAAVNAACSREVSMLLPTSIDALHRVSKPNWPGAGSAFAALTRPLTWPSPAPPAAGTRHVRCFFIGSSSRLLVEEKSGAWWETYVNSGNGRNTRGLSGAEASCCAPYLSRAGAAPATSPSATAAACKRQVAKMAAAQHVSIGTRSRLLERDCGNTADVYTAAKAGTCRYAATVAAVMSAAQCSKKEATPAAPRLVAVAPEVATGTQAAKRTAATKAERVPHFFFDAFEGSNAVAAAVAAVTESAVLDAAGRPLPGALEESEGAAPSTPPTGTAARNEDTVAASVSKAQSSKSRNSLTATGVVPASAAVKQVFRQLWDPCAATDVCPTKTVTAAAPAEESPSAASRASSIASAFLRATFAAKMKTSGRPCQSTTSVVSANTHQWPCLSCPSACWTMEESREEAEDDQKQQEHLTGDYALAIPTGLRGATERGAAGGAAATEAAVRPATTEKRTRGSMIVPPEAIPPNMTGSGVAAGEGKELPGRTQEADDMERRQELLTDRLRARMHKQGYKLVGSHSAVKLCRWTKKQLQGIGGCYKHTFYGIESHRCMEATTSLVCSNRCVFCWRHHTHPASKTFRWKADAPEEVLKGAIAAHQTIIRSLKNLSGVTAAAYAEALQPRHCALSLIGEAIMYPHINQFLELLHSRRISSFLVMNGQHPELLAKLAPVTQLYVSVDASNKDALKAIDRPLFADFWERLLHSLDVLRERKERTIVRLTLIKDVNDEDLEGYARLIQRGQPDFVEVKGVTFAGSSANFSLTLRNTPHMQETLGFSHRLLTALRRLGCSSSAGSPAPVSSLSCVSAARGGGAAATRVREADMPTTDAFASAAACISAEVPDYQLASLHEHTNAVLLANARKFLRVRAGGGELTASAPVSAAQDYNALKLSHGMQTSESRIGETAAAKGEATHAVRVDVADIRRMLATAEDTSLCTQPLNDAKDSELMSWEHDGHENVLASPATSAGTTAGQHSNLQTGLARCEWHTHIDFDRFFELEENEKQAHKYSAKTPRWATPEAPLRGFNPRFDVPRYLQQIAGRPPPPMPEHWERARITCAEGSGSQ